MLAVVGCACLFAQTCMLLFSAKHHTHLATLLTQAGSPAMLTQSNNFTLSENCSHLCCKNRNCYLDFIWSWALGW